MSKFDRYLLSQLLAVFGFFSLVLVSVYWVNRAVGLFDQLIGDGQSALVFLQFSILTLPNVIRLVLPISAFAAAVYVANRLTQESELVVMQATGVSSFQLMRPVLYFGLIVALMMAILMHVLVPASRASLAARTAEISQNISSRFLKDGQFTHPSAGITLYIREVAPTGELLDLFLNDARNPVKSVSYTARQALFVRSDNGPKLIMLDGMVQTLDLKSRQLAVTRFGDFTYDLAGLIARQGPEPRKVEELTTSELFAATPALLEETGATRARFLSDAHSRFGQPLLATVAAMIGFATLLLGAFSRFGLWRQILASIGLLLVVQGISTVATAQSELSESGWVLAYLPGAVGAAITAAMLWYGQRERRRPAVLA
ncbi:MAG: LPS export ABC transporter permease LptF [Cypionkella sp.]|nr:LPS export ABC transporter permease LptF [Cypionkella sp.]